MSQSDDTADYKRRKGEIAMANKTYIRLSQISQMIAAEQKQTLTAVELTYTDKILMWEWSATKVRRRLTKSNSHAL